MRILYVIGSLELGGAEQHLLRVTRELVKRGWKPEVFVLATGGALTEAFSNAGVPVYGALLPVWAKRILRTERAAAWGGLLLSMVSLLTLYWRRRPNITHFFLPAAYIMGGLTSLAAPSVLRVMSRRSLNNYQAKHKIFTRIELMLHRKMDAVSGNSQAVIRQLREEGVSTSKLHLIYNGLELAPCQGGRSCAEVRAGLGVQNGALMFAMVANLIPYKGHSDLVKALELIRDQLPSGWVCVFIGRDDGILADLMQQADLAKIKANLLFTGSRTDVSEILMAADIGILCSHQEGFSNAVIEGMAASLPMVVTDVGGNSEAVIDGSTGYVVPPHSPEELGQALLALAHDESRRIMFGAKGRARCEKMFSLGACVDEYIEMYQSFNQSINLRLK